MQSMRSLTKTPVGSARSMHALLDIPTAYPMQLINRKTSKEPNNRYKSAPLHQHSSVGTFLPQSRPDKPLLILHFPRHLSTSSNPQLHTLDRTGPHSHSPERGYLHNPSTSKTHYYQDRKLESPLNQSSGYRALESVMLGSRRSQSR